MMGHVVVNQMLNASAGTRTISLDNVRAGNYVVRAMQGSASGILRISIK